MIRRILGKYYGREDRAFICGLFHTVGVALLCFGLFKLGDYFVSAPVHSHAHFGLLCTYSWASWSMQAFAFVGAGLTLFFVRKWREAAKATMGLDMDEIEGLTTALQYRDAELKKSRSRFKQVVDLQMEYVNKHTPEGVLTFVNKALYEVMGYDSWEPLEGTNIYDYLEPEDAEQLKNMHAAMTMGNPRVRYTHQMRVAGGKVHWVEWQNCGVFTEEGELIRVLAVGRDVTDRHLMEMKLRDSEHRYRSLFNHMIAGVGVHTIVCRLNPDTGLEEPCDYIFLDVNPAFEHLFNFDREDIVGRTVLEVMPNTEPSLIERFGKVADTGQPDRFTCHFVDINKWFEVTAFSNQPAQFAATFLDISARMDRRGKRTRKTD
jgi:PAS domain S-box-containing protein